MFSRVVQRRLEASLQSVTRNGPRDCVRRRPGQQLQCRWITPAPKPGDGPLMSRRADRELPDLEQVRFRWRRTLPIFLAVVGVCSVAIFNYQKTSSPVVASTLYALRTSPRARALLGDEIYFRSQIPWIRGEMNQMRGNIDIYFSVRGSRGTGVMRFASRRPSSRALFETTEWSLTTDDGEWVDLLEGGDPFRALLGGDDLDVDHGLSSESEGIEAAASATRGFRQQGKTASSK